MMDRRLLFGIAVVVLLKLLLFRLTNYSYYSRGLVRICE